MYVDIALTSFDIYAVLARRSKSHAVPEKTERYLSSVAVGNKQAAQISATVSSCESEASNRGEITNSVCGGGCRS